MKYLFFTIAVCATSMHGEAQTNYLETIKVSDSIYVFKPKIEWTHSNGIAFIGPDGVFFVDTYIQTTYVEEAIQKLKRITRLPVQYVLNTHWHNDHVMGNYIFKKHFPNCRFIAHDSTKKELAERIAPRIQRELITVDTLLAQLRREHATGVRPNGQVLTESMKEFWKYQIRESEEYRRDYKGNQPVPTDISFNDSLNFIWGGLTLQLYQESHEGHSTGDVMVWVPQKRLLITGDIVVAPTPYATYINVTEMPRSLQTVIDKDPAIIIPGHGPVMYDLGYVRRTQKAFIAYIAEAEKAVQENRPVKEAMNNIKLPEIDIEFTGNDDVISWAYRSFFVRYLIYNIYRLRGKV